MRVGVAMGTVVALAFVGMLSSVFIAEAMEGAAAAINQAGTLRMQSYRIASHLGHAEKAHPDITNELIEEFDSRLLSTRLTTAISKDPSHDERISYDALVAEWNRKVKPVLVAYSVVLRPTIDTSGSKTEIAHTLEARESLRARFLETVDAFVDDIDLFVTLLERKTESKIRLLRLIQVVSLFLTLVVVLFTMYLMHTQVLMPLRELLNSAERTRRGDFSVRIQHTSNDELGQLGSAFNLMAEDLSKIYSDLEERVQVKTMDLERSNQSLELLYDAATRLNENPLSSDTYRELLVATDSTLGLGPSTICLTTEDASSFYQFASSQTIDGKAPNLCKLTECGTCLDNSGEGHHFSVQDEFGVKHKTHSFPIRDQNQQYGVLIANLPNGRELQSWQERLLEAVATQIGTAITVGRKTEESRRVALLDERNVIARELHDSLAQSLSYMKIQTSRLNAALDNSESLDHPKKVLGELREGVTSAYRQLRELLNTFRLSMDGRGLALAINQAVNEFKDRGNIPIDLHYDTQGCHLSPNEEIHVLQVVREALSNAIRHSNATRVTVDIAYHESSREFQVSIEDNGIGLPARHERTHHYGFAIMDERAKGLGGDLHSGKLESGGTRIELRFKPQNVRDEHSTEKLRKRVNERT